MRLKTSLRRIVNKLGYDIQPIPKVSGKIRTTIGETYVLMRNVGFQPKTVIDVGVAMGTEELYSVFPFSYFLLIEPLKMFETDLCAILKRFRGSYVSAAAGSVPGQASFNVHPDHLDGSSLYKETMGAHADGYEVSVPIVRIGNVVRDKQLAGPYLIKVDVQGAELDVLDGAQEILNETEAIVLEVSLFEFMKGAPQFFDVVSYMKECGFVVYDIIPGWNRLLDDALGQVDVAFVKEEGLFRHDHSYATREQLKVRH